MEFNNITAPPIIFLYLNKKAETGLGGSQGEELYNVTSNVTN
jgi:hypothetical protein